MRSPARPSPPQTARASSGWSPEGAYEHSVGTPSCVPFCDRSRGRVAVHTPTPRILARHCGNARLSGNVDRGRKPEHTKSRAGNVDGYRGKSRRLTGNMGGGKRARRLARRVVSPHGVRTRRITANDRNVAGNRQGLNPQHTVRHAATHRPGTDRRDMAERTDVGKLVARSLDGVCITSPSTNNIGGLAIRAYNRATGQTQLLSDHRTAIRINSRLFLTPSFSFMWA